MLRVARRFRAGSGDKSPLSIAGDAGACSACTASPGRPSRSGRWPRRWAGAVARWSRRRWRDTAARWATSPPAAGRTGSPRRRRRSTICRRASAAGRSRSGLLDGRPAGAAAGAAVPGADLGAGGDVDAAAPAPLPGAGHPGAGAAAHRLPRPSRRVRPQARGVRHLRRRPALREPRPARVPDRGAGGAAGSDGHGARRSAGDPDAGAGRARPPGPHGPDGGFAGADRLPGQRRDRTAVARQVVPHRHARRRTGHGHRRRDPLPRPARRLAGAAAADAPLATGP